MSMITEQVERMRRLADEMEKSTFVHEATHFIAIKVLREAADTIEQLAAKVRAENNKSQPCEDTISRQAAIDALRKLREEDIEDYGCEIPEGFNQDHLDRATFAIKQLPPIQPEIIRCKDCKHWTNNIGDSKLRDNYCNDEAHGFYYQCSEDDYCSFAERRTDEQTVS